MYEIENIFLIYIYILWHKCSRNNNVTVKNISHKVIIILIFFFFYVK